jgi:hypothetical protein
LEVCIGNVWILKKPSNMCADNYEPDGIYTCVELELVYPVHENSNYQSLTKNVEHYLLIIFSYQTISLEPYLTYLQSFFN